MMKLLMMNKNHDEMSIQLIGFCTCHEKKNCKIHLCWEKNIGISASHPQVPHLEILCLDSASSCGSEDETWVSIGFVTFVFFFVSGVSTSWII